MAWPPLSNHCCWVKCLRWQSVCLQCGRPRFDLWVRKTPCRRKWQPSPVFLPGESHRKRSPVGYSSWGRKESDMTERLHFLFLFVLTHIHMLKPWSHCVSVWRWEVVGSSWGQEGGMLTMGLESLLSVSLSLHHMKTQREGCDLQDRQRGFTGEAKWSKPWSWISWSSELWKIKSCCLSHPGHGILFR